LDESSSRRGFLKAVTALGAVGLQGVGEATVPASPAAAAGNAARHGSHDGAGEANAYLYFTTAEAAFVEAALAILIPADELGPGALEAGVAHFIDRDLAGAFGAHARNYRQGPWAEGTPEQGFQSPLTPGQIFRAAIAETDRYCLTTYGKRFDDLDAVLGADVLRGLEAGGIALDAVPAPLFFSMLWAATLDGFFADPMYGGNRGKAGWALVGFPGVAAAYGDEIEHHNVPYRVTPVSISDIRQGRAAVDRHGHAIHARLDKSG
jgi:gluconate 2-dehydrogenase gamma chain